MRPMDKTKVMISTMIANCTANCKNKTCKKNQAKAKERRGVGLEVAMDLVQEFMQENNISAPIQPYADAIASFSEAECKAGLATAIRFMDNGYQIDARAIHHFCRHASGKAKTAPERREKCSCAGLAKSFGVKMPDKSS